MNARVIPFQRTPQRNQRPATYGRDEYLAGFMDATRIIGDGLAKRDADHAETVMAAGNRGYAEGYTDGYAEGFRAGRDAQRRWDRAVAS